MYVVAACCAVALPESVQVAASKFSPAGTWGLIVVECVVSVCGGLEQDVLRHADGAHQRVDLVETQRRRTRGGHVELVLLVEIGVEVAVGEAVHVGGVRHADDVHHRVVGGAAVLAAPREGLGQVGGRRGGPHAQAVHVHVRVGHRELDVNRGVAQRLAGVGVLVHGVDVRQAHCGGQSQLVHHGVAKGVLHRRRQQRHEGVEVHGVGALVHEVQLHRQHALRGRHLRTGADKRVVRVLVVTTRCQGRSGHFTRRHVIAVHFSTVQVRHHTIAVVETRLVGSHARNTGEGLAEVLRARHSRSRAQRDGRPAVVVESVLRPGSRGARGHLPLIILLDGVVKGQSVLLAGLVDHVVLEEEVVVLAANLDVGTRSPGIAVRVLHLERVLAAASFCNTVLKGLGLVIRQSDALDQSGRSR